jgi:hypothetical protein
MSLSQQSLQKRFLADSELISCKGRRRRYKHARKTLPPITCIMDLAMIAVKLTSAALLKERAKGMIASPAPIAKARIGFERSVSRSKWFDYSWLSPLEATALFAQACLRAHEANWCLRWQSEEGLSEGSVLLAGVKCSPRDFTDLWSARRRADSMGIPYDFFMKHLYSISNRRRGKLRPVRNQIIPLHWTYPLYTGLRDRWRKHRRVERLMVSELPQYRNEAFCRLPAQIAHRNWVLDQIELRGTRDDDIGRMTFVERLVPADKAIARFGSVAVRRAEVMTEHCSPAEHVEVPESSLWPACFVMPHAIDLPGACSACPASERCAKGERVVRNALVRLYGTDDPGASNIDPAAVEAPKRRERLKVLR